MTSFCSAKATHIFSAKNIRILYIESAKTVNEMTLNELVKLTTLWTTGPWYFSNFSTKTYYYAHAQDDLNLGIYSCSKTIFCLTLCSWSYITTSLWMRHYENRPIQIYWKFYNQKKGKFSDKNFWYFSYFISKHRLWVLVRTASARQF